MSSKNNGKPQIRLETVLNRPTFVLIGCFGILLAFSMIFLDNTAFDAKDQSARLYLLSTIAQALAAVFGIVISLVLVGVQLTAQHYSQRANILVLGDPLVVTFTALNIATIVTSLTVIANAHFLYVPLNWLAKADEAISLSLAGVCLMAVPFLLYRVSELMTPVGLANKLLTTVTREAIMELPQMKSMEDQAATAQKPPDHTEDPLTPFVGIVRAAIKKGHYDSANRIMRLLAFRLVDILRPAMTDGDQHSAYWLTDYVLGHLSSMLSSVTGDDLRALRLPLDVLAEQLWFEDNRQNFDPRSPQQCILRFVLALPEAFNDHVVQFMSQYGPSTFARGAGELAEESARILRARNLLIPVEHLVDLLSRMISASAQAKIGYQMYLVTLQKFRA